MTPRQVQKRRRVLKRQQSSSEILKYIEACGNETESVVSQGFNDISGEKLASQNRDIIFDLDDMFKENCRISQPKNDPVEPEIDLYSESICSWCYHQVMDANEGNESVSENSGSFPEVIQEPWDPFLDDISQGSSIPSLLELVGSPDIKKCTGLASSIDEEFPISAKHLSTEIPIVPYSLEYSHDFSQARITKELKRSRKDFVYYDTVESPFKKRRSTVAKV